MRRVDHPAALMLGARHRTDARPRARPDPARSTLRPPARAAARRAGELRRAPPRGAPATRLIVPVAATLSVDADAGTIRLRLEVPERDHGEPLQREFRQALDEAALHALVGGADELLRGPERADFLAAARARGTVLHRALVPAALRDELRALSGPLVVSTSLPGIPWELLHDGEEFWGLRYALGRRLVLERPVRAATRQPTRPRPRALVVGADPRGDLPCVAHELEVVCEALEHVADVDAVGGRLATFDAVVAALGRGYDLVHFCGHVVRDGSEAALLLAGEARLAGPVIEASLAGRPLVFVNGCASARGEAAAGTAPGEAALASAAHAFLLGGALAVVGTLAQVGDRHAATLAESFYRGVLAGAPIGEALRAARHALRADPDGARSPAWLSVVLYGNPVQVLTGSRAALAAGRPKPRGDEAGASAPEGSGPAVTTVPAATIATTAPASTGGGAPAGVGTAPVAPAPTPAAPASARAARTAPGAPRPWTRRLAALAGLAVVVAAVIAGLAQRLVPVPTGPVVVGVMAVRSRGAGTPDWMLELTRDGLNTVLSRVPAVRVYSRQKIDFLRERRQLSEIEAAETLGMSKMLSASVAVERGQVTLDLEVVDIASGLLQSADRVQGPEDRLIELQTELAVRALDALGVHPTEADLKAIVASRDSATLEAYRLLTDTLGEPPREAPSPTPPAPMRPAPTSWWRGWDSSAWAEPADPDELAIRALLARYAKALETKSIAQLAALQLEMSDAQRASLERYFAIARDLRVAVTEVDVLVDGDEAVATFTRADDFVDAPTGRTMHLVVRVSGLLTRRPDGWRIRSLREPS